MSLYHATFDAATGEAILNLPLRHDLSWLSKVAQSFRDPDSDLTERQDRIPSPGREGASKGGSS